MLALGHGQPTNRPYLYLLTAGAGAGISVLLMLNPNIEPFWILLAVVSAPVLVIALLKFPAAFIVPVMFVPQVKDSPELAPLQHQIDLTVFFLVLLSVAIILRLLFGSAGQPDWSVRRLLAGQGRGVAAWLVFAAVVTASYLYTPGPYHGAKVVTRLWGVGLPLFLSPLILVRQEKDFRHFSMTFLFSAMALAIALLERAIGWAPGGTQNADVTRIGAGWLMGMATLLVVYYRLFERRLSQSFVGLFCFSVVVVGLLASTSRGAILSLLPVVVMTSLLLKPRQQLARRIIALLGVLAFFFVIYATFLSFIQGAPGLRQKYEYKTLELEQLWAGHQNAGSAGERLPLYESALQGMWERPIFGLGVGGWSVYYYGREQDPRNPTIETDPHNLVLQVGAEQGIVGLIALFAFLGTAVSAMRRVLGATADRFLVLAALLLYVMFTSMFSGNIDSDRVLWIWCGMIFAIARTVRERRFTDAPAASQPHLRPARAYVTGPPWDKEPFSSSATSPAFGAAAWISRGTSPKA